MAEVWPASWGVVQGVTGVVYFMGCGLVYDKDVLYSPEVVYGVAEIWSVSLGLV